MMTTITKANWHKHYPNLYGADLRGADLHGATTINGWTLTKELT